jgi:hypothetical protein
LLPGSSSPASPPGAPTSAQPEGRSKIPHFWLEGLEPLADFLLCDPGIRIERFSLGSKGFNTLSVAPPLGDSGLKLRVPRAKPNELLPVNDLLYGSCRRLDFLFGVGMRQLLERFGHFLLGKRLSGSGLFGYPDFGSRLDWRQWLLSGCRLGLRNLLPRWAWTLRLGTLPAPSLSFFRRRLG